MFDLSEKNLARIQENNIPELTNTPIETFPFYQGLNLANIPTSICHWFGIPAIANRPLDLPEPPIAPKDVRNIILLVIDGLPFDRMHSWLEKGLQKNHRHACWKKIQEEGLFTPLTSVVPSTTANALTSLWTGKVPAEHGVIGYELFLKEFGITVNMILQTQVYPYLNNDTPVLPRNLSHFLPVSTLGSYFREQGIQPFAFQHEAICNSGLSQMLFPDVTKVPFTSPQDMWQKVNDLLAEQASVRKYLYLYWSDIDTLSHHDGPDSRRTRHAWQWFGHLMERFLADQGRSGKNDTLLLITSDHGQIPTFIQPRYEVRFDQKFMSMLKMPPSGESRCPYLFIKPGKTQVFHEYLESRWPGEFTLFPPADLVTAGLFGSKEMSPLIQNRLGNFVALPKGNAFWWWANKENRLLGRHGGFSQQEMVTPFLLLPI